VRKQPRLEVPQTEVVVDVVKKGVWKKEQETLRGLTMGSINMRHDERVRAGCVVWGTSFPAGCCIAARWVWKWCGCA
jgi:hypothetical protein